MANRILVLLLLSIAVLSYGRDKQENWLQVSSQHFTVVSNGNEKDARRIADQFERMRLLFHTMFPNMHVDPSAPIIVLAVKDAKGFRALEAEAYLAKGQLQLAGLFLRAPDKNYVLLRMDAGGEHPYATIYHEYTHLLLSTAEWIPLWLNEGLAEFYQNTDISEKHTFLGEATPEDMFWLRQNRILPLATLLAVDHNSPYYHEEKKGSIFYAESWALTHYLQVRDAQQNTYKLTDYMLLVARQMDPVAAAAQAFGDLKQLQTALEHYIGQYQFSGFRLIKDLQLNDATFKVQALAAAQADAVRADFLAYNQREKDARTILDQVLHDDPSNTLAHETMGYLAFRDGHLDQAQDWYEQAVKLNSQSYLANYYFAVMAMNRGSSGADVGSRIESSLRNAIKFNDSFAPAYDRLAAFYESRGEKLDEAHMLSVAAVQLDPGNVGYRVNTARTLMSLHREKDATDVLQAALKLAKTPEEALMVQNDLETMRHVQAAREQDAQIEREYHEQMTAAKEYEPEDVQATTQQKQETLSGPHRFITGMLKNVRCSGPAVMDFDVEGAGKKIAIHAHNYYTVLFSALNYKPAADLQPCIDLEGMSAKVEYVESASTKTNGLIAVELRK